MDELEFLTTLSLPDPTAGAAIPIPLSGLQLWLDAADTATITLNPNIAEWRDKSGNGNTVTQATEGLQPTQVLASQNGNAIVRLNGSNQYMGKTSPTGLTGFSTATCFAVSLATTTVSTDVLVGCYSADGGNFRCWRVIRADGDAGRSLNVSFLGTGTDVTSAAAGTQVWSLTYFTVNTTTQTLVNNGNSDTDNVTTPLFASSSPLFIGINDPANASNWAGDIGEIIFYNRVLTAGEITAVSAYLTAKWGL